MSATPPDRWSRWLLERRDAGSERQRALTLDWLRPVRDRLLALAGPLEGATLLDVGAGDGLIGREALARGARVIFSDVSPALLDHLRATVDDPRASFVDAQAEDLAAIPDASVDVVTTRSVLIYVDDKAAAFAALRRVLRPGGRISLYEPINVLMFPEPHGRFWGYDVTPAADLAARVSAAFAAMGRPAMVGFDDRDLFRLVEAAGFARIHVETHADVEPDAVSDLDALLDGAPNPNAPTVREVAERELRPDERRGS
ncbi:MAG TPA: class I SAM-dependent methyltransferase [Solirubrobacter sp.]|nr:class I SAM-dependent methyltransferase [Solirubrobacter sp.]